MSEATDHKTATTNSGPVAIVNKSDTWRVDIAIRIVALALICLAAAAWPLWLATSNLPSIPSLPFLVRIPLWFDRFVAVAFLLLAVATTWRIGYARWLLVALALLMALDQLRWQAWALHAVFFYCIALGVHPARRLGALRALSLAVYAYAALAKFDYDFASTLGQQFLELALPFVDTQALNENLRIALALMFPLVELATAVLLAIARTRAIGTMLAVALHLALAVMLSPVGLNHSLGVVLWNVFFAAITFSLFAPRRWLNATIPNHWEPQLPHGPRLLGCAALMLGIVVPALGLLGQWDPWPSWALYAPQRENLQLLLTPAAAEHLPGELQKYLVEPAGDSNWLSLDLESLSLDSTGTPLYPGTRVKSAVALAVADHYGLFSGIQLSVSRPANRMTGERTYRSFTTFGEMNEYTKSHRLSTDARWPNSRRPRP